MAANVNVTVEGTLVDGAGAAIGSAEVKAIRQNTSDLISQTMNTDDTIEATSNASTGIFSLALKGYDLFAVTYKIVLPDGQYFYLRVPPNALSTGLGKLTCGRTPSKGVKNITDQIVAGLKWIGQTLASAAALPQPTCDIHAVSGTTNITSIVDTNFPIGKTLTLIFAGVLTFTDGNNLDLTGNYTTSADDSITMFYDGADFKELCRSGAV